MEREAPSPRKLMFPMRRGKRFLGTTYGVETVEIPHPPAPEPNRLTFPMRRGKRFLGTTYGIRSE